MKRSADFILVLIIIAIIGGTAIVFRRKKRPMERMNFDRYNLDDDDDDSTLDDGSDVPQLNIQLPDDMGDDGSSDNSGGGGSSGGGGDSGGGSPYQPPYPYPPVLNANPLSPTTPALNPNLGNILQGGTKTAVNVGGQVSAPGGLTPGSGGAQNAIKNISGKTQNATNVGGGLLGFAGSSHKATHHKTGSGGFGWARAKAPVMAHHLNGCNCEECYHMDKQNNPCNDFSYAQMHPNQCGKGAAGTNAKAKKKRRVR